MENLHDDLIDISSEESSDTYPNDVYVATENDRKKKGFISYDVSDSDSDIYVNAVTDLKKIVKNETAKNNKITLQKRPSESALLELNDAYNNAEGGVSTPKKNKGINEQGEVAGPSRIRLRRFSEENLMETVPELLGKINTLNKNINRKENSEANKLLKKIAKKNLKPEDYLKLIKVQIDDDLTEQEFGGEIIRKLHSENVNFTVLVQTLPRTIRWTRLTIENGCLVPDQNNAIKDVLLILDWKEFLKFIQEKSLINYFETLKSILGDQKITLLIYGIGIDEYTLQCIVNKDNKGTDISGSEVNIALLKLQILYNCSYRMMDNAVDLATFIFQFTKSLAQLPYFQQQQENTKKCKIFMAGENKDNVTVDNQGNGLKRLWHQTLITFPLASLETAEAIALKYPTPAALMQAYNNCESHWDGERLLQDIPIRRNGGPLANIRKVGPELSKKIYKFFTTLEPDLQI